MGIRQGRPAGAVWADKIGFLVGKACGGAQKCNANTNMKRVCGRASTANITLCMLTFWRFGSLVFWHFELFPFRHFDCWNLSDALLQLLMLLD